MCRSLTRSLTRKPAKGIAVKTRLLIFLVCAAFSVAASSAYAAGSTQQGYGSTGGNTQIDIQPAGGGNTQSNNGPTPANTPTKATNSSGSLPFTGRDLGLVAGVGLMLLLTGVGVRRITRHGAV